MIVGLAIEPGSMLVKADLQRGFEGAVKRREVGIALGVKVHIFGAARPINGGLDPNCQRQNRIGWEIRRASDLKEGNWDQSQG